MGGFQRRSRGHEFDRFVVMIKKNTESGLSLIETLVTVTVFAILGVIISSSLILTIAGSKKSEATIRVRENVNYALSVIERNLRNADSITDCTDPHLLTYVDQYGRTSTFSCQGMGGDDPYIASGSSRLTSATTIVLGCSFTCSEPADWTQSPMVTINVAAKDSLFSGSQTASISAKTNIYLRN